MPYQALKLKEHEKDFILVGEGRRHVGRVFQGPMKGDVFWGLKALEIGVARERVLHRWTISIPTSYGGEKNTMEERRYLVFTAPATGSFVLRFQEYVTPELLRALRVAFGGQRKQKEESHAEQGSQERDPAGNPVPGRKGKRPDADRKPAEAGRRARRKRPQKVVVKKPPKTKR